MNKILVIDDEKNIRTMLARALDLEGFAVEVAEDGKSGLAAIDTHAPDLVLLDLKLPDITGLEVLEALQKKEKRPAVIMMSGHGTLEAAVKATQLGAIDFTSKPLEMERLFVTIKNALTIETLGRTVGKMRRSVEKRHGMVGSSVALNELIDAVRRAAPTKARVLITGESGVGKELVAAAIHESSNRADEPFVKLNCAAISQTLVESELFGHEKGAFTGADKQHRGRFERAHKGTIFLDEIGEMPLDTQARLLRVLQEGELERVGGNDTVKVDVRVIAATNRDLLAEVKEGKFREDLYYRLNVLPIEVPPLRARKDDIPALAMSLLDRACRENELEEKEWSEEALQALSAHDFPGNVRELVHLVERLAILTAHKTIAVSDVKRALPGAVKMQGSEIPKEGRLYELLEGFERRILEDRIAHFKGNMSKAADDLGLERSHLYKKVRRLGIKRD